MCLIIHKPVEVNVPHDLIEDALGYNPDGWGIMYKSENNGIEIFKGLQGDVELTKQLESIPSDVELFIHLRMRTHGLVNYQNCHPFQVGNSGVHFMHNGVITNVKAYGNESDTGVFNKIITPLVEENPDVIFTEGFKSIVNGFVGSDRLVFLHPDGRHVVLGTGAWHNHDSGLILSNTYAWSCYKNKSYDYTNYSQTSYNSSNNYTSAGSDTSSKEWFSYTKNDKGDWVRTTSSGTTEVLDSPSDSTTATATPPALPAAKTVPVNIRKDDGIPSELFVPTGRTYSSIEEYQLDLSNLTDDKYTLDELLSMDRSDLADLVWDNPEIAVEAIWQHKRYY